MHPHPKDIPPYRDSTRTTDERVYDLLSRMTVAEKAGQLFHGMILMGPDGSLSGPVPGFGIEGTHELLTEKLMTHFNIVGPITDPAVTAKWYNTLQRYAINNTRLGIPITISTDPRNHFTDNVGTRFNASSMSQWPETLSFAALRDAKLVERFADIARQEYVAMGIRVALRPQIDLATEYRWSRINATFGEHAELSDELAQAYVRGFQGKELGPTSVSTMTKHFPGGGLQLDGEDPHFVYGQEQVYPGKQIEYHLKPFEMALEAGTRQIMPGYGMPIGTEWEQVGFGLNRDVITDLLRGKLGFEGIVCTDWGLLTDVTLLGQFMPARAWGCEHLSQLEKAKMVLDAGCDQFGGDTLPELVIELVETGQIHETRLDQSVFRIMKEKFLLGLFDNPFVDVNSVGGNVGAPEWKKEGERAQRRAYTLLKNDGDILPLRQSDVDGKKVYVEGIDASIARARGLAVTDTFEDADLALLRLKCPYDKKSGGFEALFHSGSLEFSSDESSRISGILDKVPISIVEVYLDRPAVLTEIAPRASALTASYGSSDDAFFDIVFGSDGVRPEGKLPFDLPRSMEAVVKSRSDVPFDTENPLFRYGYGLAYRR
ncbi:glycosyl hydrolase family 3 N terminal domain-containing protein [Aspergillus carlsbadensis]|nr:glycosyl hydrolase family 3 N terminal domain-containing protein [Aspergillus carlsbadensis]